MDTDHDEDLDFGCDFDRLDRMTPKPAPAAPAPRTWLTPAEWAAQQRAAAPVPAGPRCPMCQKALGDAPHTMNIQRNWRWSMMDFCSFDCGGNYQMGCEG